MPKRDPRQVIPFPQVPSVDRVPPGAPVGVIVVEVLVFRVDVVEVGLNVDLVADVGMMTVPPGPARYQLEGGSPRHSPTVTDS